MARRKKVEPETVPDRISSDYRAARYFRKLEVTLVAVQAGDELAAARKKAGALSDWSARVEVIEETFAQTLGLDRLERERRSAARGGWIPAERQEEIVRQMDARLAEGKGP